MSVELNHTIVHARDKAASARFLAELLETSDPSPAGPFLAVRLDNGVTLDFEDAPEPIVSQHYAFLVDDPLFDRAFSRIAAQKLDYWADPLLSRRGEIARRGDARGFYFRDPSGHLLELLTRL